MKILFNSLPSHGHTYPLLPLALAARDQGHEIIYSTWGNFHPPLVALGLDVVHAGADMQAAFGDAMREHRIMPGEHVRLDQDAQNRIATRVFGDVLPRSTVATLRPVLAERRPDLVIYEAGAPGAAIAAAAEGVPAVCHGIGRGTMSNTTFRPQDWLSALAEEVGVEYGGTPGFPGGTPYLDIYPLSLQDPEHAAGYVSRIPLRPTAFAEPGELPDWVTEHREKLIYLTLGTAFGSASVLRAAIDGLAATGHRVLVAAGPTVPVDSLGDVPANVTVLPWVPQADLLPHTDLVVHHGGAGTTLGTAAVGVPQLVLPQGADQFVNADAISAHGSGRQLVGPGLTAEAVTAAADGLLADESATKLARSLADEIAAMPTPAEVAERLPEYA
ncbi:glycosyltransferase [Actinokineospora enzanensis]|uniref:glycosyltransferase n=1 Tax=Actinokineospora enzanensis TaxID=155975 RepID=UPI00037B3C36|nr:glycosyltransferase [Actinokineospora enzanensis]